MSVYVHTVINNPPASVAACVDQFMGLGAVISLPIHHFITHLIIGNTAVMFILCLINAIFISASLILIQEQSQLNSP